MKTLRAGGRLGNRPVTISIAGLTIDGVSVREPVIITVTISDFTDTAGRVFFGDRPLNDPGYTAFKLSGAVGAATVSDTAAKALDVFRVEQRLRYLGYSTFGMPDGAHASVGGGKTLGKPKELKFDGIFGAEEESALRAFYGATHYKQYWKVLATNSTSGANGFQTTINNVGAKTVLPGSVADTNLGWLNAYNAPHWMNIYTSFGIPFAGSTANFIDGTTAKEENYATSWTRDLLEAWVLSKGAQGLTGGKLQINGLTDPTYDFATHNRGGHSVGMGIDLGVGQYIISDNQTSTIHNGSALSIAGNGWSVSNAIAWSNLLPPGNGYNQRDALKNFLSIYALTQTDGTNKNGTLTGLADSVKNGETASTLFGSGEQDNQALIQNVWIGGRGTTQNPYPNMRYVLSKLGFTNSQASYNSLPHTFTMPDHQNHFHIDLRPPTRVAIEPTHNLLADNPASEQAAPVANEVLVTNAQSLLDDVKTAMNLSQGEVTMFIQDMPDIPPQNAPVMIAQANQAQLATNNIDRTVGVCHIVPNGPYHDRDSAENLIEPAVAAFEYFRLYEHRTVSFQAKVTILQNPKHGILKDVGEGVYSYQPNFGYLGKDQATVSVEIGGFKVKVAYFFQAIDGVAIGNTTYKDLCGKKGYRWKISTTLDANGNSTLTAVDYLPTLTGDSASVTDAATLASILGEGLASRLAADTTGITLNIADLPGSEVGQTTGTTITLDTNAAGYGWYIDPNPAVNTDFLPTSNPDVWMAKAGSAAAGKMDMLSVLLHEYGHALGLDHSANLGCRNQVVLGIFQSSGLWIRNH
jgi:hypothetical protein